MHPQRTGVHPAHAWPEQKAQVFKKLKPGEYTKQPVDSIGGYGIYLLESRYEKPAESFGVWRAVIETYAKREQSCGRKLFQVADRPAPTDESTRAGHLRRKRKLFPLFDRIFARNGNRALTASYHIKTA